MTPEYDDLQQIGAIENQRKVLDAWSHIALDAPLLSRQAEMQDNIAANRPFWNIHVGLAWVATMCPPRRYLEIGVRTGASMVQVLHNAQPEIVTGVDLWTGEYAAMPNSMAFTRGQLLGYQEQTGRTARIELIQGNSHIVLPHLRNEQRQYDMITVDGDHSDEGAMADLEDAYSLLDTRGVIMFDDITHESFPTLLDVVKSFVQRHSDLRLVLNTTQDNGTALIFRNIPPLQ